MMIDNGQRELLEHRSQRANESAFAMVEAETITMERVPGTRGNECGCFDAVAVKSQKGRNRYPLRG